MRITHFFLAGFVCLFLIGSQPGTAYGASVSADLDKTTARVREEIHLVIRVTDAQGNIQAPRIPGVDGFDIFYTGRSSQLTFINGQSTSSLEFSYLLIPQKAGQFTLPPIEISAGGQNFRTEPAEIQITAAQPVSRTAGAAPNALPPLNASSAAPSQASPPISHAPAALPPIAQPEQEGLSDDNVYVLAQADKTTAYPGEQILLTYSLYYRYDTRLQGFKDLLEASGFWIEEYPMEQNIPPEVVNVGGKRYMRAIIKKYALFPTAPADYTVSPGTLKASIRKDPQSSVFDEFFNDSFFQGGGFFSKREEVLLSPPPLKIIVQPYPENGKPKNFEGATGNFRLTGRVDKTQVNQDEPVTLTVVLEGEGNIETLPKPVMPELENFRTYDGDTNHQLFKTGDRIGGRKTFEMVFIPTAAGRQVIPSMEYSFFNPAQRTYQTLKTPEFILTVAKSDASYTLPNQGGGKSVDLKKDIQLEKQDIRFIHEDRTKESSNQRLKTGIQILALIDLILLVLTLLHWGFQKHTEFFSQNVALKRKLFAGAAAKKNLRRLQSLMQQSDPEKQLEYFEKVEDILTQYLTDKMNLSVLGTTRFDLEIKLEESLGSEKGLLEKIRQIFSTCESARFAKVSMSRDEKIRVRKELVEILNRLDHIKL